VSSFIPLAAKLLSISEAARAAGQEVIGKAYYTLHKQVRAASGLCLKEKWVGPYRIREYTTLACAHAQIWDTLPGFLDSTADLEASFKTVAKLLGTALTDRADLRVLVCRALQTAIKTSGALRLRSVLERLVFCFCFCFCFVFSLFRSRAVAWP
jgi:hypothetical protein